VAVAGKNKKRVPDTPQEPEVKVQPQESFVYPQYDMPRSENRLLWHGIDSAWVPGVTLRNTDNTKRNPFDNAISL
jgi:hypothetical protein